MSAFFEANLALVRANHPDADAEWIAEARYGVSVRTIPSRVPEAPTLLAGPDDLPLHSVYNPPRDARLFANQVRPDPGEHILVLGFAGGYHLEALLARVEAAGTVTAVELVPEVLRAALEARDLSALLSAPNFRLIAGLPEPALETLRRRAADILRSGTDSRWATWPATLKILPPEISRLSDAATVCLSRINPAEAHITDRAVYEAFDDAFRRRVTGDPLDDSHRARLFAAGLFGDEHANYFATRYEPAPMPPDPKSILVIHLSSIGDVVAAAPALAALRRKYPSARIGLMTEEPAASLFRESPHIDALHAYSRRALQEKTRPHPTPGALREIEEWFAGFIAPVREARYDLAVNLHTSARSAVLATAGGAAETLGFSLPDTGLALVRGNAWHFGKSRAMESFLPLAAEFFMLAVEAPPDTSAPLLVPDTASRETAAALLTGRRHGADRPLVGINPGSNFPVRMWDEGYFITVGRTLVRECNARVVVFGGASPEDKARAERIAAPIGKDASLCVGHPLPVAAAVIERCDLLVTNDTGPMHIAGAVATPVVATCGPTWNLPYGPRGSVALCADVFCQTDCGPMADCERRDCLRMLPPAPVAAAAQFLLTAPALTYPALMEFLRPFLSNQILARTTGFAATPLPLSLIPCSGRETPEPIILAEIASLADISLRNAVSHAVTAASHFNPGFPPFFPPEQAVPEILRRLDNIPYDAQRLADAASDRCSEIRTASLALLTGDILSPSHPARPLWNAVHLFEPFGFNPGDLTAMLDMVRSYIERAVSR